MHHFVADMVNFLILDRLLSFSWTIVIRKSCKSAAYVRLHDLLHSESPGTEVECAADTECCSSRDTISCVSLQVVIRRRVSEWAKSGTFDGGRDTRCALFGNCVPGCFDA